METEKLERLEALFETTGLSSVWFARPNSFAWLTGGTNVVNREADGGVAAVGYDGTQVRVLTDTIEADRIEDEELPDLPEDTSVETYPWYASSLEEALAEHVEGPAGADLAVPGFESVDPTDLRQPLTETDLERYRDLGRETALAVESVCRELRPEDTEHEVASALSIALNSQGIEAPVVLVGGSRRARAYRHYTPKKVELGEYALVSVTAQRFGLHASCTRTVAFDPPEWLEDNHTVATRVEATALAATQEAAANGGSAGDVFGVIQDAYATLGFDGEWERHHQGGAAGFAGREWTATPDHEASVSAPMAYAWNPTVQGAKSEDTHLVSVGHGCEDGGGDGARNEEEEGDGAARVAGSVETLTSTGQWPTRRVQAVDFDFELERPGILGLHEETA